VAINYLAVSSILHSISAAGEPYTARGYTLALPLPRFKHQNENYGVHNEYLISLNIKLTHMIKQISRMKGLDGSKLTH